MSTSDPVSSPPKALTFDVFGTVVNWRKTVVETLIASAQAKVASSSRSADVPPLARHKLHEMTDDLWAEFAQEWRDSYMHFTRGYRPNEDPWRDIDEHHHLSLQDLLKKWQLEGLYGEDEVHDLSRVWHFLEPWSDSPQGLKKLGTRFTTSTLSNGNQALQRDLDEHGHLGFHLLQSAEDFKAYKPQPSVYLGAAKKMGLQPQEVAMVAAHLGDLKAARDCGFRTIYIERPQEEAWKVGEDNYEAAKEWIDIWITDKEDGFVELARRFGIR